MKPLGPFCDHGGMCWSNTVLVVEAVIQGPLGLVLSRLWQPIEEDVGDLCDGLVEVWQ